MMQYEPLFNDATRHLVRIAAAVAGAPIAVTRRVMNEAVEVVAPASVDEVLLQSYLFAGFPRTLNAFTEWREVAGEHLEIHPGPAASTTGWLQSGETGEAGKAGEAACRRVYGQKYDALRQHVRRLHPEIDEWMVTEGYGKVLSRSGLPLAARELCIVAACAASEQVPQLRSHIRGSLNCGATCDDLARTLSALGDIVAREALSTARDELNRIKGRMA